MKHGVGDKTSTLCLKKRANFGKLWFRQALTNFENFLVSSISTFLTRSPASAGIANRPLVFLGIFLIFGLG